jgi:6-phosphogluconolactonase
MHSFNCYKDSESVAHAAANYIYKEIRIFLAEKNLCHIALPGGSTPARCLELLALKNLPWDNIHCYIGDERCLPVGDAERNDTMIQDKLWSRVEIPEQNVHVIEAERGADAAASLYTGVVNASGRLDIVVLGMGEDGHTASLFPDNPALDDTRAVVPVYNAPKPPPERVSLGMHTLRAAAHRVALVTGSGKRDAMTQIMSGSLDLPIAQLGSICWFLDESANAEFR